MGKFLKPCVGLCVGKQVRSVSSYSEIVNRVKVVRKLVWKSKVWVFWCLLDGCHGRHRLAENVLQLPVVGVWNTQLSIPTNVYLKIQMFVSKAKTN